jgi:hypothetical protein
MGLLQVNFTPLPDMKEIRLFVDGANKGAVSPGQPVRVPTGQHSIQYKWNGYDDSPAKTITITENGTITDAVSLNKSAPRPTGSLQADKPVIEKGQSVTLRWQVNNADSKANIAISGVGSGLKPSDSKTVTPSSSTDYVLTANGVRIGDTSVSLKDAPPPPPPPALDYFNANTDSIEVGKSVTLNWRVSNASGVTINGQAVNPQGSKSFTPSAPGSVSYTIAANGVAFDQKITVNVTAPPPPQPKPAPTPAPAPAPVATLPDADTLQRLLGPVNSALNSTLFNLKDKECKAKLSGLFGGGMADFASQCGAAQSITLSESECRVFGSPESPVLSCKVPYTITAKSGPPFSSSLNKSFHFSKSGNSFTLTGVSSR